MATLHAYVLHAKWLKDRQRTLDELRKRFAEYAFQSVRRTVIHVVSEHDPEYIDGNTIKSVVDYSPTSDPTYDAFLKNMHIFQLSCCLKHRKALHMIAEHPNPKDFHLVLEDDVVYQERMCLQLDRVMKSAQHLTGVVFLGMPSTLTATDGAPQFQKVDDVFKVLPYNDSYLIDAESAKRLLDAMLPIKFVPNVQLSHAIKKAGVDASIACPNIFMDGSKAGVYLSALTANNQLIFHPDYVKVRNVLDAFSRQETSVKDAKQEIDRLFLSTNVRQHPDMMYLWALYEWKVKGDVRSAQRLFESALKIYQANSCIIGQESQLLKDYMRTYRDAQDTPLTTQNK